MLWIAAALALLAYAGEVAGGRYRGSRALRRVIWLVAVLSGFGAVLNLASPSMWERLIWVPVSLATCALSVLVARSVARGRERLRSGRRPGPDAWRGDTELFSILVRRGGSMETAAIRSAVPEERPCPETGQETSGCSSSTTTRWSGRR